MPLSWHCKLNVSETNAFQSYEAQCGCQSRIWKNKNNDMICFTSGYYSTTANSFVSMYRSDGWDS